MAKRILISVTNDLSLDQRIHRIATTLHAAGYKVEVVGRGYDDSPQLSARPYKVMRLRPWFRYGKVFYMEYWLRLGWYLFFSKADILNANDLDTLLPNFLVASFRRKKLIYDTHEYFTEVPELLNRPFTRKIWLKLEEWIFPRLKTVYTVNGSIAKIYSDKYGVPVSVIRNLPFSIGQPEEEAKPLQSRKSLQTGGNENNKYLSTGERENPKSKVESPIKRAVAPPKKLIYQGALNLGRGIELMIDAMAFLPDYELIICGMGNLEATLRLRNPSEQVRFMGLLPFKELSEITATASLGFSLEEDLGMNYRLATPNKLYDYVNTGVPALVSDLPEMAYLVRTYGVGEILAREDRNPEKLAQKVKGIVENPEKWQTYHSKCLMAAQSLHWECESEKLLEIYRKA